MNGHGLVQLLSFLVLLKNDLVSGHGRMMDPPSRNAMWRLGYNSPINLQDDVLFCGGADVLWSPLVNGKCGLCGDPWFDKRPRPHEIGGTYDKKIIGRKYTTGQVIDVRIDFTVNHYGTSELRLCAVDSTVTHEMQECFNKFPLYLEGQSVYQFKIPTQTLKNETINYRVHLPENVSCQRCVIQWTYYGADVSGVCDDGKTRVGCGPQEIYRNCADVSITDKPTQEANSVQTKLDLLWATVHN